jgi:hypothetical protein
MPRDYPARIVTWVAPATSVEVERLAREDGRSVSQLVRMVLEAWLRDKGAPQTPRQAHDVAPG